MDARLPTAAVRAAGAATRRRLCRLLLATLLLVATVSPAQSTTILTSPEHDGLPLGRDQLRALFMMRVRAWPDGTPIRVFVMPDDSDLHQRFCRELLGTFPYVLRAAWDRKVFTGTGLAPEAVPSVEEMQRRVRETPGAIGYVEKTAER